MTPNEIKAEMVLNGITQADVARSCKVTRGHVHRVIMRVAVSDHVQRVIAAAINLPVEDVFDDRYWPDPVKEAKLRKLSALSENIRHAV